MAGFLGFLGLTMLLGDSLRKSTNVTMEYKLAKKRAEEKNDDIFYADKVAYWTKTCEPVEINNAFGCYKVIGVKSGRIYKNQSSENVLKAEENNNKLEEALKYCKKIDKKYLPWYFPHSLKCMIKENTKMCTGIEVETKRKYICFKKYDEVYGLVYLEEKPHRIRTEYGVMWEYDAIHENVDEKYRKNLQNYSQERHIGYESCSSYYYLTKINYISQEEYKERLNVLEKYPYEMITIYGY